MLLHFLSLQIIFPILVREYGKNTRVHLRGHLIWRYSLTDDHLISCGSQDRPWPQNHFLAWDLKMRLASYRLELPDGTFVDVRASTQSGYPDVKVTDVPVGKIAPFSLSNPPKGVGNTRPQVSDLSRTA
ncbi:hypothetical protein [Stieleria varia]|nr:hypothetical protein [Stieleria varia]